jgi:DNA-binding transcriptional ArsR family regulator
MLKQPLRIRILRALELCPMTVDELARALDARHDNTSNWLIELRKLEAVKVIDRRKGCQILGGRPSNVWSLCQ